MRELTPGRVKAFFTWLLNQRRGKGGRRVKGLGSEDSMGTYKYFRLAYERATGGKIFDGKKGPDRMARRVSQLTLLPCCILWFICSLPNSEIISERRRQRDALLKKLREEWDVENPVREISSSSRGSSSTRT
jgi:hypothetical protein